LNDVLSRGGENIITAQLEKFVLGKVGVSDDLEQVGNLVIGEFDDFKSCLNLFVASLVLLVEQELNFLGTFKSLETVSFLLASSSRHLIELSLFLVPLFLAFSLLLSVQLAPDVGRFGSNTHRCFHNFISFFDVSLHQVYEYSLMLDRKLIVAQQIKDLLCGNRDQEIRARGENVVKLSEEYLLASSFQLFVFEFNRIEVEMSDVFFIEKSGHDNVVKFGEQLSALEGVGSRVQVEDVLLVNLVLDLVDVLVRVQVLQNPADLVFRGDLIVLVVSLR